MTDVSRTPDALDQEQLDVFASSVKPDRTDEDLLFQVLLDWGLEVSLSISRQPLGGCEVFSVDEDALIACFDAEVPELLVRAIAKRHPLRVVFKDAGFASDAARINAEQIFRELSPETEVRAI